MASAVAKKEFGVVITSSPHCTPSASRPKCSAAVPLLSATQCRVPQKSANSRSKASTSSPCTNAEFWQTRSSAGRISSRNSAYSAFRSRKGTFINQPFETLKTLLYREPRHKPGRSTSDDTGRPRLTLLGWPMLAHLHLYVGESAGNLGSTQRPG